MLYIYVLKNHAKGLTYIGYTKNLQRRIKEHKLKIPELIYYEAYRDERDARRREKMLKQRGQAIRQLKGRLQYSLQKS